MKRSTRSPWKRAAPKGTRHTQLAGRAKRRARARAARAGRRYPNLVDNMRAASEQKRRRGGRRRGDRGVERDPHGGLTAAGRRAFARREGAHLKPGVKKRQRDMTREEMRRKGSWATRFYGRKKLPALRDERGRPTRFALTAAAWGEPVPRTAAAARKIAAKGKRLLARYRATGVSRTSRA